MNDLISNIQKTIETQEVVVLEDPSLDAAALVWEAYLKLKPAEKGAWAVAIVNMIKGIEPLAKKLAGSDSFKRLVTTVEDRKRPLPTDLAFAVGQLGSWSVTGKTNWSISGKEVMSYVAERRNARFINTNQDTQPEDEI